MGRSKYTDLFCCSLMSFCAAVLVSYLTGKVSGWFATFVLVASIITLTALLLIALEIEGDTVYEGKYKAKFFLYQKSAFICGLFALIGVALDVTIRNTIN